MDKISKAFQDFGWIILLIIISSCNGCKKTLPPIDSVVDIIEQQAKPVEDSLRKENIQLKAENDSLIVLNKKLSAKKEVIREQKANHKQAVAKAEEKNDSAAIITALKEELKTADVYISIAEEQAATQGNIIINNEKIITNLQADVELQKSKFNQLKTAYNIQETQLNDARMALTKTAKKLKRAKAWNKIFGIGTAAGVGLAAFIFL